MGSLGYKSRIYDGDTYVGDVEVFPMKTRNRQFPNNEIRINYFTPSSERCPPLSILLSISPSVIRYKLQSKGLSEHCLLFRLHASCFRGLKTAVVLFEDEELHLVAMPTKQQRLTCFWCFSVPLGLYMSCLGMLNLRCLAIVFDLDETLIVANTMKSFEDKIEALRQKRANETDPFRISGMSAVLQRYVEDRALLKQYTECDYVMDNGKLFTVQLENVPLLSNNVEYMIRPVIRLQEKNVILTRINPEIRDTSVLVRLRPAWEDLKSYLTANGRKRFEVFVCTMAERDYALEMWRLLDPKAHLINTRQLLERVVCVKPGLRKSLLNVFQNGICHPKMAMVIDDRQNVWEDNDQCRVHVVPAFTPYAAPQAETANAVPVLCVARNVASNVRSGFFKEFNDNLLRRTFELSFEDDTLNLPSPPDVSSHLMLEALKFQGTGFAPNGRRDALSCEGINYAEVERRINQPVSLESDRQIRSLLQSTQSFSSEDDENHASTSGRDVLSESGKVISLLSSVSTAVLQEIGRRCSSKVEFNYVVSISEDLPWSVEVLFAGEKVGTGVGKTKKEAQLKASEDALHNLADQYREDAAADSEAVVEDYKLSLGNENGFLWEFVDFRLEELQKPCVSNSKAAEDDVHGSSG